MGDEGGAPAVPGLDLNLLVDHGGFFVFVIPGLPWASNTIASKPEHDKVRQVLKDRS
jgi:hypothetical protein